VTNPIFLNSAALKAIAEEMRVMNIPPNMEMPHTEYMAASGTYAVIAALESLAHGLKAAEEIERERTLEILRRRIANQRLAYDAMHKNELGYIPPIPD
jgi:hypothetical protein